MESAATTLGEAGARVEPIGPLITDAMLSGLDRFWRMRSLRDLRALPPENQERMLPYLREWMDAAADRTGMELFNDFSQLEAISIAARDAIDGFDYILCPVAPVATFSADLPSPAADPARALEHIAYTVTFSISGHPGDQRAVDHHLRRAPDRDPDRRPALRRRPRAGPGCGLRAAAPRAAAVAHTPGLNGTQEWGRSLGGAGGGT